MYCGLSSKGRCKQVKDIKDISEQCEVNHTTKQKRCKRKTVKDKPKKYKFNINDRPLNHTIAVRFPFRAGRLFIASVANSRSRIISSAGT